MSPSRGSGGTRGLVIGLVGGVLWWLAVVYAGSLPGSFEQFLWQNEYGMPDELGVLVVMFFGPMAGVVFSIACSIAAERTIQNHRVTGALPAAAIAAGAYALALAVLFTVTREPGALLIEPLAPLIFPLTITGITYVGLLPLVGWAVLAGAVHGVWRPRVPQAAQAETV